MKDLRIHAFSLVELLVVIGIIAVLISILLPSLSRAQMAARTTNSLSNLRQIGLALATYRNDNRGYYPLHAWQSRPDRPRTRWPDSLFGYLKVADIYRSPNLAEDDLPRMNKPFTHTTDGLTNPGIVAGKSQFFGGYGYNWQYLGNGREVSGIAPFFVKDTTIRLPHLTLAVADTDGSRNGTPQKTSQAVYVIDPPLGSLTLGSRGSRRTSPTPGAGNAYYTGGTDLDPLHRSAPAPRYRGKVTALFVDGHAEALTPKQIDDPNNDGIPDNALFNGRYDATVR